MGRKGGPKTGGRVKGTPNKANAEIRAFVTAFINDYKDSGKFMEDFEKLLPHERVRTMENLMAYVVPKLQAVEADVNVDTNKNTIVDIFRQLADDT